MKGKLYDIPPAVETLPRNVAKVPAKSRERQTNVSMSVNNRLQNSVLDFGGSWTSEQSFGDIR